MANTLRPPSGVTPIASPWRRPRGPAPQDRPERGCGAAREDRLEGSRVPRAAFCPTCSRPTSPPFERGNALSTFTAEVSSALGGPAWLVQRRAEAFERFSSSAIPTEAEEVWRYSGINSFDLDAYAPVPAGAVKTSAHTLAVARRLADSVGPRAGLVVTVNGTIEAIEMAPSAPESLSVSSGRAS